MRSNRRRLGQCRRRYPDVGCLAALLLEFIYARNEPLQQPGMFALLPLDALEAVAQNHQHDARSGHQRRQNEFEHALGHYHVLHPSRRQGPVLGSRIPICGGAS